jgi:hypothetical protein
VKGNERALPFTQLAENWPLAKTNRGRSISREVMTVPDSEEYSGSSAPVPQPISKIAASDRGAMSL